MSPVAVARRPSETPPPSGTPPPLRVAVVYKPELRRDGRVLAFTRAQAGDAKAEEDVAPALNFALSLSRA